MVTKVGRRTVGGGKDSGRGWQQQWYMEKKQEYEVAWKRKHKR